MPCVGIATMLSGSVYWLRRVGLLQPRLYWISNEQLVRRSGWPEDSPEAYALVIRHHDSLHELSGWLLLTKHFRELVLVAFALLALSQLTKWRPRGAAGGASIGLILLAGLSALATAAAGHWFALLAGIRSFLAWLIGLLASSLVDEALRRRLARVCAWTLVGQGLLVSVELMHGLPTYSIVLFGQQVVRVVGSFNLPASLGAFVVVAWAAALCWGGYPKRTVRGLGVLMVVLLVPNASATAWGALFVMASAALYSRARARWRPYLLAAILPAMLAAWFSLPIVTGRFDIHDSLWGRIAPVQQYAERHLDMQQALFGVGFGLGTNAVGSRHGRDFSNAIPDRPVGDSTPAALLWQVGLVGMLCAYALLAMGLLADPASRALGIAIAVSSVALNIGELFPVNLILGIWLANALATRARRQDG
jgi:hypothetical protein